MERRIYLLLTDTNTLLTNLIKLYTRKPYNHASIAFNSELTEVYSFGRKMPRNPFIGGFVKEDVRSDFFKHASCSLYSLRVTEEEWLKMHSYIREMEKEKEDYRYNFLGLFGFLLNRPFHRERAFFCSQFVASVLKEGISMDRNQELSLIKPSDLPFLTNFQFVYEGSLGDYVNGKEAMNGRVAFY